MKDSALSGNVAIVIGYLKGDRLPSALASTPLSSRCALLLSSCEPGNVDADFDRRLYAEVLSVAFRAASADAARVVLEDGATLEAVDVEHLTSLFTSQLEPKEPFAAVAFFRVRELRAALTSEPYALVGGPAPYHDTYTQSFYGQADVTAQFIQQIRANSRIRVTDSFQGSRAPTQTAGELLHAIWRAVRMIRSQRRRNHALGSALLDSPSWRAKGG